ncbi:PH domain-containing protein [Actinoplanes sp. NPDC051633]|uniref:PH domain-containing protein n=1 Tax=Actinoplanes sp. NPDC051633 TaxID=3155670 RepID=UPI003437FD84
MPIVMRAPMMRRVFHAVVSLLGSIGGAFWITPVSWTTVSATIATIGFLAVAVRLWFLRVEVHPGDLVLVNWIRTVRVPWRTVDGFRHNDRGIWVRRTDGADVRMSAFDHFWQGPNPWRERTMRSVEAQLEDARKMHRSG